MATFENSTSLSNIFYLCAMSTMGSATFTAWFVVYSLLCPLFLFVLFIGITKCRRQRNSNSVSISHSDVFTFHMMAIEMLMNFGGAMFMYGLYTRNNLIADISTTISTLCLNGQTYFHCLTCGERYLAVVHPITYLRLKKRGGVTIRNISIGLAWILSFCHLAFLTVLPVLLVRVIISLLMVVVAVVPMTLCSMSALYVLIRPGPGDGGGKKKQLDQSKLTAFITLTTILGVLLVRMVQLLVLNFWFIFVASDACFLFMTTLWLSLPSSLVLPLLFLHRAGKLPICC